MSSPKQNIKEQKPAFYTTPEHECSYLPGRNAITLFADPEFAMDMKIYTSLSKKGFRRSGKHVYKPQCHQCSACVAIRLPVKKFIRNRNQKRNWKRNNDLKIIKTSAIFNYEHYRLYQHYLSVKHPDSGMENPDPESYMNFLITDWATTTFYEFRKMDKLLAVAVVDELLDGLSAVYTFYDPNDINRSMGRYAILTEIEIARNLGMQWLYLGYWITGCKKMQYKDEYKPLEYFYNDAWCEVPPKSENRFCQKD